MAQLLALVGFGVACSGIGFLIGHARGHDLGHEHQRVIHTKRMDKLIDVIVEISPETLEVLEAALARLQQLDAEESVPPRSQQLAALDKLLK